MEKTRIYKYILNDGLEYPQTYQYSEFEGLAFLKAYKNSRNSFIKKIKNKLEPVLLLNSVEELCGRLEKKKHNSIKNKSIKINEILYTIFINLNKSNEFEKRAYFYLNQLVKKYEVKKKLHYEYDANFREKNDNYKCLNNYIFLSINLLLFFKKTKNLKFLNTALKLNDMLCSILGKLSKLDLIMLLVALKAELDLVKNLYNSKGIKI